MQIERLKEKVLENFYPKEEELEKTREKYSEISDFIEEEFERETHFAGSSARETCIKGDRDIDVFVLFPRNTSEAELEERGLEIGRKTFEEFGGDHHVEYAEHPYTRGEFNGHEVEIVPCYDVGPESIKSSVDRTPHHSRWVQENLNSEQRKDVVILKVFLRSEKIYGSSLKTQGFSGYLCEILIAHYGSFEKVLENALKWRPGEVIDPADRHGGKLPNDLEEKFSSSDLVVVDPVDPERNVASVLSTENLAKFIYKSWEFQKAPGMDFFQREDLEISEFEIKNEIDRRGDFLVIEFEPPEEVEDIVYPQMRKTLGRLEDVLRKRDFRIFESGFHVVEKARIFFELDAQLPEIDERKGPRIFHGEDHIEQFTSKYDNVFVRDDRLHAKIERQYTDAREFLSSFLREDLEEKGIPDRIADEMRDYQFSDPTEGEEEWLKYLAKKLNIQPRGE